jgi:pimeloyl-ACP methyl ester carboxylesterase
MLGLWGPGEEALATIETNGVKLHYERSGSGETVLLAHGYLFDAAHWRPQTDALAPEYDVIAVDLRGQGSSETTDDGYDLWNQAEDLHGLIGQLGIAPVHYVGLSMGGMIGMRLALRHPEDIRSLVLLDTTARGEDPDKVERYEAFRHVVEKGDLEAVTPALPPIFFDDDFIRDHADQVEAWLDMLRASNIQGLIRAGRGIDARDEISDQVGAIGVPTLVAHGSGDAAIELDKAQDLAARIPGARFELIDGAGHQSNVDHPAEVSSLISSFLAEIRTGAAAPR